MNGSCKGKVKKTNRERKGRIGYITCNEQQLQGKGKENLTGKEKEGQAISLAMNGSCKGKVNSVGNGNQKSQRKIGYTKDH